MVDDPPLQYVPLELCTERYKAIQQQLIRLNEETQKINLTLIGPDQRGGLVKDVQEIRSSLKGAWSGRDKAILLVALIEGIVAIAVAFC